MTGCPCGRPGGYDTCCGRLHRLDADAGTAEDLMRSRYSAYAVGDEAYLLRSWDPATRPVSVPVDDPGRWLAVDVVATAGGGLLDAEGTVEFRAHHRDGVVHENSVFRRVDQRWVYVGPGLTASANVEADGCRTDDPQPRRGG